MGKQLTRNDALMHGKRPKATPPDGFQDGTHLPDPRSRSDLAAAPKKPNVFGRGRRSMGTPVQSPHHGTSRPPKRHPNVRLADPGGPPLAGPGPGLLTSLTWVLARASSRRSQRRGT